MRGEFIEACCLGIISPIGSSPVHQPWPGRPTPAGPSPLLNSEPSAGCPLGQAQQLQFSALRGECGPKRRSRAIAGDSGTHLEVPDIIHLPAKVEVELSNQQPIPVSGEPRSAAAVWGCHVAGAIKVAEVLVSFEGTREQRKTHEFYRHTADCRWAGTSRDTQDKGSTLPSPASAKC